MKRLGALLSVVALMAFAAPTIIGNPIRLHNASVLPDAGQANIGGLIALDGGVYISDGTNWSTICTQKTGCGGTSLALSFAPDDGAGLGGDCSCSNVTDATGAISMSISRASSALCVSGSTFALCGNDLPRIQNGGYFMEDARTNLLVRSDEFDNAAWIKTGGGGGLFPTITTGQPDPLGGTEAERFQYSACTGFNAYSVAVQLATIPTDAAGSLWVKGVSGSGTISLYEQLGFPGQATQCNYNSTDWTLCEVQLAGGADSFGFGCMNYSTVTGHTDTGAGDVYVWRGQAESGQFPTSSIATTSVAATRAADSQLFGTLNTPPGPGNFCLSATIQRKYASVVSAGTFFSNASLDLEAIVSSTTSLSFVVGVLNEIPTVPAMGTTAHNLIWSTVGTTPTATWDGAALTPMPAAGLTTADDEISIGAIYQTTKRIQYGVTGCN